jgi:glycosyltransferase involved in cell wall biosynthesis
VLLSLLICHLRNREAQLTRLLQVLRPQTFGLDSEIEILIDTDQGEVPTGTKRNRLIQQSKGSFLAFIDDDDLVHPNYVRYIAQAIAKDPQVQVIGIEGIITFNGDARVNPRKFIHSIQNTHWYEKDSVYYRTPNHINPIRRDVACTVPFQDITIGEDHKWSTEIRPLLTKETYISTPIYYYLYKGAP